jgi:hypothetical protein
MADEREIRRLKEELVRNREIGAGEKRASANPPNESKQRPNPPGGSGGGSETGQGKPSGE